MKQFVVKFLVAGVFVLSLVGAGVTADMPEAGEMSPEQKAMMEQFQKFSATNENHDLLAAMAGQWDAVVEHQMGVDAPVQSSEGSSDNQVVLGGRFLEQNFSSTMNDMPYQGRGFIGYDNIQKKFQSIWMDNFGTGIMISNAVYDKDKRMFSEEGSVSCPMTNGPRPFRAVTTLVDADHYTFEMFMKDEKGAEFRAMRIQYTRAQ